MAQKKVRTLTRDQILKAPVERRVVEAWGGSVILQEMTGREREEFEADVVATNSDDRQANEGNLRAWMASFAIVDEAGDRMFSDAEGITALGNTSSSSLIKVCAEIQKMNGIGEQEVEDLTEDFGKGPSSGSTTA